MSRREFPNTLKVSLYHHAEFGEQLRYRDLDIVQDIAICSSQFKTNHCQTKYMAPAMAQQCSNWETCMNRDPTTIGRAKVSAELIAEVINGFVEPISWKALVRSFVSPTGTRAKSESENVAVHADISRVFDCVYQLDYILIPFKISAYRRTSATNEFIPAASKRTIPTIRRLCRPKPRVKLEPDKSRE